jgi:hypothetical protein
LNIEWPVKAEGPSYLLDFLKGGITARQREDGIPREAEDDEADEGDDEEYNNSLD